MTEIPREGRTPRGDEQALAEMGRMFDRRLAAFRRGDMRARLDAAMATRGRVRPRPTAGPSF
jgi:hypothetical protein